MNSTMPQAQSFFDLKEEVSGWRHHLHERPELTYAVNQTAQFVVETLASFGVTHITTGIAETGVVALIQGRGPGRTIGLRADMDALPIQESADRPWKSKVPGLMHACGHDGHTAMLLGAAKHLVANRNFDGTVACIFQPAEEAGLGGRRMVQEGLMDRFNIAEVFGMHNMPGLPVGQFGICVGPIMSALDEFDIVLTGRGGHAAKPHQNIDPIAIAGQVIVGLQTLVSRFTNPLDALVISLTKLNAGSAYNITPDHVELAGTVRTLVPALRDFAEQRITHSAQGIARAFGGDARVTYRRDVPVTLNHPGQTYMAVKAARKLVGSEAVNDNIDPGMGSEDFAFMLEARPGAFIFLGNGPTAAVHNSSYDFNDDAIPYGIGYWVALVETALSDRG